MYIGRRLFAFRDNGPETNCLVTRETRPSQETGGDKNVHTICLQVERVSFVGSISPLPCEMSR